MAINEAFIAEIEQESKSARAMIERIPAETFDWKPHEKSMPMGELAGIVASMFGWFEVMIDEDELDFAKGNGNPRPRSTDELVKLFEERYAAGMKSLKNASDEIFSETWILRNGETILQEGTKLFVVRQTINHMAHHRGQLSVYLRLKDIPVPPIYGPSADEGWT